MSYEAPAYTAPSYSPPSYAPPCYNRRTFGGHKNKDKDKLPCTSLYRL